ncbi:hypothetical protein OEA41_008741 [Lepraria neglecta]|uniref:Cytochrome P450 n=1 Tax=Lepraria neglecta TaxID=209136 RepID=A0AAD9Z4K7_9LECA|nr:hypothetical protein OEA41_008741 [Lepraria neglecta]
MDVATAPFLTIPNLPPSVLIVIVPFLVIAGVLTTTRLYTTIRYCLALPRHTSATDKSAKAKPPPPVPYTIPILGHAISFLAPRPGKFWANLFRSHPRATGSCTLLLGGRNIYILFSPSAVQALFKTRGPARDGFNLQIVEKGLGIDCKEGLRFFGIGEGPDHTGITPAQQLENIDHNYLLGKKSVNELTAEFVRVLRDQVTSKLKGEGGEGKEKDDALYAWLQDMMFNASTTAFMGSRILEVYPNLREDFFNFDRVMLTMFFGIPKWLSPKAYNVREKTLGGLIEWQQQMQEECKSNPADPDGDVDWEPVYGSRANRARQRYYASRGLNTRTRAGIDLGFLFGLSSNAIPAAGWMLMHILDPEGDQSLLSRVMEELERARRDDGTLDIPTLIGLPLLHSVLHEVLRLYVDVLVTRELEEDLKLPLDDGKRQVLLKKNAVVMAPSWLGHRDEALWVDPPCHQFCAERFLKTDPETGKSVFSTSGTNGKFFPFGGGKSMCPGRVFGKQEILASVALVLLAFEFEPLGFVDEQRKSKNEFPGLRKSYSGSGIMAMDGDMRVKIKSRK